MSRILYVAKHDPTIIRRPFFAGDVESSRSMKKDMCGIIKLVVAS